MKTTKNCEIDNAVDALKQAIEKRKAQKYYEQLQAESAHTNVVPHLFSAILNRAGGSYGQMSQVLEKGSEFAQDFIKKAQQGVEENPWDALRKVGMLSFGIGLFLSRRHQKSSSGEK